MNLKQIRNAQGLSVQKLADRTGLHRRTLQDIEKRDDCLVSNAILLADALGVTLDELCRTKDEAVE
ncbi:MAG: helix-turn-helix transcriptional regulator [Eubacterium sp.]